ncbi:hypothetical protein OG906_41005 (plasmid) [Streptomyces sp. NBC_01426]|uniref:hypothetical protein n=1 Tax=Streptomyces sp. NBC_01426 TaxID=2975866 RepID=UPI002E32166F|nr:hypothetical protein [Streptomyces sp. NBC_01426]
MTTTEPGRIARWRARRAERVARLANAGRLTPGARGILGTMGISMVGTGGFAVFLTEVEAGPTALITIGGLLVVLATMGRRISSMNLTDGAFEFEQHVREELDQAQDDSERVRIASNAVAERPRIQNIPDIAATSEHAYQSVLGKRLIAHFGDRVEVESWLDDEHGRADFVVAAGSKSVIIETAFGNPTRVMDRDRLFKHIRPRFLMTDHADAIVIVSNMLEPGLQDLNAARNWAARGNKAFSYVRWTTDIDTAGLIRSVEAHLQS